MRRNDVITPENNFPAKKHSVWVFLAGPIQGASEWQFEMPEIENVLWVSPRRRNYPENLDWNAQTKWETEGLRASDVVLFWIPPLAENVPGRDYGQTTRTEIGEILGRGVKKVIMGVHPDFPGRRYFEMKMRDYHQGEIHNTLEECIEDLKLHIDSYLKPRDRVLFTSDTHFSSDRALQLSKRPFFDAHEMDWAMIEKWNSAVHPWDKVYHLGDFGEPTIRPWLNGDITLLYGNYEHRDGTMDEAFEEVVTEPTLEIQTPDGPITLCHEPLSGGKEKYCLFGHIHGRQKIKEFGLDVGVDAHNFRPITWNEVKFYLDALKKGYYDQEVFC